ncbi:hypothetical protein SPRG_07524 [Saprolegnia parasitica CBS 223.65]|uniref:Interferon-related developmental regulator N-terminal domain-containing protein n=1 Tax=Saprolegnia parasitica (strain CBS 223.65) TaxID=695850 RepID=A0A067CL62_SAPPC|nr:hypothetical protein SPRG_07524 [Saprolegnia parasitica CBS 223.65]KDO27276.1 hypothetical protein SPRG_07524 [Saprolegnia parasitica CBS 223.65]|eukprot:XP_012202051.1 hypothetical protein SPRG_07524 [Saprolegnia parasitica CBS 223.65]
MGKKTSTKHARNGYDSDDGSMSLGGSVASSDTDRSMDVDENDGELTQEEALRAHMEELLEKRTTTRVSALKKIEALLAQCIPLEMLQDNVDTLQTNVLYILRRPSPVEGVLGAQILALMALILGANEDGYYSQIKGPLHLLVKSEAQASDVRAMALQALGTICFICSSDQEDTHAVLSACTAFFGNASNALAVAALDTWGCLASTLPSATLVDDSFLAPNLEVFLQLLEHADVDVRSAAGENIALFFEALATAHVEYVDRDVIAAKLLLLSKDSSKKTSKRDRKEQRTVFRDVYKTVADDVSPSVTFSFQNEMLRFQDWCTLKQYSTLKKWLHVGFQEHLKYNNTVRGLLDLPLTSEEQPRVEKRDTLSKNSHTRKHQSAALKDQRAARMNQKNLFLADY